MNFIIKVTVHERSPAVHERSRTAGERSRAVRERSRTAGERSRTVREQPIQFVNVHELFVNKNNFLVLG